MSDTAKIGVIGVGHIGRSHLRGYRECAKTDVVAIADVNAAALTAAKEEYGVPWAYEDYGALLARDDIVGVSVCTPPFNHAEITIAAAQAGKHILCEKPMCMTASEARAMVTAAREAGVRLGICSGRARFGAEIEAARDYVLSGRLGEVYYLRITSFRRRGRPGIDILKQSLWFLDADRAGGGALYDVGCYDLDQMLYILGSPAPRTTSAMTFRGIPHNLPPGTRYDVDEHVTVFVRFEGGVTATLEKAWAVHGPQTHAAMVLGSLGGLSLNPFTFYTDEDGSHKDIKPDLPQPSGASLLSNFADVCLKGAEPKTPGEDGLKVMLISDAALRSAAEGHEVEIEV
jgi:predicted dehydrogenase